MTHLMTFDLGAALSASMVTVIFTLFFIDFFDTAGTLTKAADMMIEKGAKSVRAFLTHPVLSGEAYEKIESSKITALYVTDTIPIKQKSDKIKVLSVADLFAGVFRSVVDNESISSHFIV